MYVIAGSASLNNLKQSILSPVSLDIFRDACKPEIFNEIKNINKKANIQVRALSDAHMYTKYFKIIDKGDVLL